MFYGVAEKPPTTIFRLSVASRNRFSVIFL